MHTISYRIGVGFRMHLGSTTPVISTDLRDDNLSSEDIDARLIYFESIGITGRIIDIRGNYPRTSLSDAAVASLTLVYDNTILEDDMTIFDLNGLGLTSDNIDIRLNYWASINIIEELIDIRGNESRTSASDAAVVILTATLDNTIIEDN